MGGHPECDVQRGRIESLIKALPPRESRAGPRPAARRFRGPQARRYQGQARPRGAGSPRLPVAGRHRRLPGQPRLLPCTSRQPGRHRQAVRSLALSVPSSQRRCGHPPGRAAASQGSVQLHGISSGNSPGSSMRWHVVGFRRFGGLLNALHGIDWIPLRGRWSSLSPRGPVAADSSAWSLHKVPASRSGRGSLTTKVPLNGSSGGGRPLWWRSV